MPNSAVVLQSELHDHAPNGQIADPTALNTLIAGSAPWAHWPMAADPYDISGNAHHGYHGLAPTYGNFQITGKAGLSCRQANSQTHLPTPQAKLGTAGGTYTLMGLFYFEALPAAGSAVGDRYRGSTFWYQATESTSQFDFKLGFQDLGDGASLILQSGLSVVGGYVGRAQIGKAMVIAVVGTSLPALVWTIDVWINGVKLISGYPRYASSGGVSGWMSIGRLGNTERLAQFVHSNVAAWSRELTPGEIMDLTEAYMDKAAYAGAWKPRVAP